MKYQEAKLSLNNIKYSDERQDVMFDVEHDHLKYGKISEHTKKRVLKLIEENENSSKGKS